MGEVYNKFLVKHTLQDQEEIEEEEFYSEQEGGLLWKKFLTLFEQYLRKFYGITQWDPRRLYSLSLFDEFFDHLCEQSRFKINAILEFFETVVKFKNDNMKEVSSFSLKKKMENNLFFVFTQDLLNFIDQKLFQSFESLVSLDWLY